MYEEDKSMMYPGAIVVRLLTVRNTIKKMKFKS